LINQYIHQKFLCLEKSDLKKPSKPYLTSREVTEQLQITPATLYAYVSRGLIRSEMTPDDSRQRRYSAEDVLRLINRKAQRRDPAHAAQNAVQQALYWGEPVMDSALTLITDGELYYRGHPVAELVSTASFEEICGLLWLDDLTAGSALFAATMPATQVEPVTFQSPASSPLLRMQIALAETAEHDMQAYDHSPQNVARIGVRVILRMAQAVTGSALLSGESIAQHLANAWGLSSADLLQITLILCADHELNVSAFTARAIASADASPYQAVIGALAALQGYRHGGVTQRAEAMLQAFAGAPDRHTAMQRWLQSGQRLAGFGQPLYPNGDPRGRILLDLLYSRYRPHPELDLAETVIAFARQSTDRLPNIDFALVVLQRLFQLPTDAALILFALGRTAGWIAHIIEQYERGTLIRPRAIYKGRLPISN
jgi:citrate synthase